MAAESSLKDDALNVLDSLSRIWTERPELFDQLWPVLVFFFAAAFLAKRKPTTPTKPKAKKR
jgi:hypothetical protein